MEHSSFPGQMADIVISVMDGITMNIEKQWRNTVMKRWLRPLLDKFSISPKLFYYFEIKNKNREKNPLSIKKKFKYICIKKISFVFFL